MEPSKTLILAEIMKDSTNLILTSLDAFFDDKLGGEGLSMDRFFFFHLPLNQLLDLWTTFIDPLPSGPSGQIRC